MDNNAPLVGRIKRRTFMIAGVLAAVFAVCGAAAFAILAALRRGKTRQTSVDPYTYDLGRLPAIDPALIRYERTATMATGFDQAKDMAIGPDGRVYIANGRSIVLLDADGSRRGELPLADAPRCVAVDEHGLLFIGMKDHVEVRQSTGVRQASWPVIAGQPYITSIAIAPADVFVADAGNRVVWRYNRRGELIGRIDGKNAATQTPGFVIPSPYFDVRIGPSGRLWVANTGNHRLESYDFDGEQQWSWGKVSLAIDGFCGCCNPCRFNLLPGGRFITSEKGLPRVKVYTADGELEAVVAAPATLGVTAANFSCGVTAPAFAPPIVAADHTGRILLLHPRTGELAVFTEIQQPQVRSSHGETS